MQINVAFATVLYMIIRWEVMQYKCWKQKVAGVFVWFPYFCNNRSKELTDDFDIVHIFNFSTYEITNRFMEKAHQLGIPIVSSCIYWDYSYSIPPLHYFFGYPSHIRKSCVLFIVFIWKYYCLP